VSPDPNSLGRNDPCHCGSGKKYKACCLAKDEAAAREARAKAAAEAPAAEAEAEASASKAPAQAAARHQTHQPWKSNQKNTKGFQRFSAPRKVGGG
jgi:SEC-C motif-containing protein